MKILSRKATIATVIIGVVAVALGGWAPAHAVGNPSIHSSTSVRDAADKKSATVTCPAGTRVYGAGGEVYAGNGNVVLDEVVPDDDLNSVRVEAIEHGAYSTPWEVSAWAICGAGTLNLQRIEYQTASNSTSSKNAYAYCPANLRLYGMGAEIVNGQGDVVLDDYEFDAGLTRANAGAYAIGNFADNWSILAYAICGNAAATMQRVSLSSSQSDTSPKYEFSNACPAGTYLHGLGGQVTYGLGDVMLNRIKPWPDSGSQPLMTDTNAFEVGGSSPANPNWMLTSHGVCSS